MKKISLLLFVIVQFSGFVQLVQGEIKVKEQSKLEIQALNNLAINLYSDFLENKFPIQSSFTGNAITFNSDKKMMVQFVFTTLIKKDVKEVGTTQRNPILFFPEIC